MLGKNHLLTKSLNRFGGKGEVIIEHILDEKLYNGKIALYAKVTLKPGCSLGLHKHETNSETYFVLQGTGKYNDNGAIKAIQSGDTAFCPAGESHAIENTGAQDLILMALIVNN